MAHRITPNPGVEIVMQASPFRFSFFLKTLTWTLSISPLLVAQSAEWPAKTFYRTTEVLGHEIFYREAGDRNKPTILLLHGYPSSSHTYRELIPLLSGRYHVLAPDNLGSGYSEKPDPSSTKYNFDVLADHVIGLMENLGIEAFVIYMQDFGAPVGFRVMMQKPGYIRGLIAQNANAYLKGIPPAKQAFFRNANADRSPENLAKLFDFTGQEAVQFKQYLRDVQGKEAVMSPDAWTLDSHILESRKARLIQVALFQDYHTNLEAYPKWQAFMREQQFPTLIVWGKHDPVFTEAGARAYLKDVPKAKFHLLDAGHFAAEEQPVAVAKHVIQFMTSLPQNP